MSYPNAFYNVARWLSLECKEYENALETYKEFIKNFRPSLCILCHDSNWRNSAKLGAPSEQVLGAYLETGFRYGDTPGSSVVIIRLMSQK